MLIWSSIPTNSIIRFCSKFLFYSHNPLNSIQKLTKNDSTGHERHRRVGAEHPSVVGENCRKESGQRQSQHIVKSHFQHQLVAERLSDLLSGHCIDTGEVDELNKLNLLGISRNQTNLI